LCAAQIRNCQIRIPESEVPNPDFTIRIPARVNLIGDHVDYNAGLVLPIVIDRHLTITADRTPGPRVRIRSTWSNDELVLENGEITGPAPAWAPYVHGVLALLAERGIDAGGFDARIESTIPVGAGLASSAALEVATATLVERMAGVALPPREKARLCRRAEHEYAGVPCGIMDQIACVMGTPEHALLIDCRSEDVTPVPLWDEDLVLLVVDSGMRHDLADGAYAQRRDECVEACRRLGVDSLRDVDLAAIEATLTDADAPLAARAWHVVTEIGRTGCAAWAARAGAWEVFGVLMTASHRSLAQAYEVSTPELDELVEILTSVDGVLGARLTGAGFGGCVIVLAKRQAMSAITRRVDQLRSRRAGASVIVSR
jgi:galactokinase